MDKDEQKQFTVFSDVFANNTTENKKYDCLDQNVNFYNTYNYTLYAPTMMPWTWHSNKVSLPGSRYRK